MLKVWNQPVFCSVASVLGKHGGYISDSSCGVLYVMFGLAEAGQVVGSLKPPVLTMLLGVHIDAKAGVLLTTLTFLFSHLYLTQL